MTSPGYDWSLQREGDQWRWRAVGRDNGLVLVEGLARTRAEGAAYLACAMSLGVLRQAGAAAA